MSSSSSSIFEVGFILLIFATHIDPKGEIARMYDLRVGCDVLVVLKYMQLFIVK